MRFFHGVFTFIARDFQDSNLLVASIVCVFFLVVVQDQIVKAVCERDSSVEKKRES